PAGADRDGAAHDHQRRRRALRRHRPRGGAQVDEIWRMRLSHDRRRDTDDRGVDGLARQMIGDANALAEEGVQPLGDARLEEVRATGGEAGHGVGILVVAVHGEALARERHRQGDPDISEADDENVAHSKSPSATSRIAFSRSPWRPTSSQYSLMAYAATRRPRARCARIRSVASQYSPSGIAS